MHRRLLTRSPSLLSALFAQARFRQILLTTLAVILVFIAWRAELGRPWSSKPKPDTIEYHWARFQFLQRNPVFRPPTSLKEHLNVRTINWYLEGKPTAIEQLDETRQHRDALLRLGYFQSHSFTLSTTNWNQFIKLFHRAMPATIQNSFWVVDVDGDNKISIACRNDELPAIQKTVDQINQKMKPAP